jgi:hypothetical protein
MTRLTTAALAALTVLAAACGGTANATGEVADQPVSAPVARACAQEQPDCVDTIVEGEGEPDAIDEGALIREAESLLGRSEDEVLEGHPSARLGRHGDEHLMLTEDYMVGRMTIATEDDGSGTFRVVEVTLELTDAPIVITELS